MAAWISEDASAILALRTSSLAPSVISSSPLTRASVVSSTGDAAGVTMVTTERMRSGSDRDPVDLLGERRGGGGCRIGAAGVLPGLDDDRARNGRAGLVADLRGNHEGIVDRIRFQRGHHRHH